MNVLLINKRCSKLKALCFKMPNFSYVCREAVNGKYKSLHAVIEMVEPVLTIDVGISRPTEVVLQERASNHLKVL